MTHGKTPSRTPMNARRAPAYRNVTHRGAAIRSLVIGTGVVLLVAGVATGVWAYRSGNGGRGGAGKGAAIDVVEAMRQGFEITTTATGDVRAKNQIELRNELDSESTVTEIIPEGTQVKAGDVLVKLNSESIQQKVDQESLELESIRAAVVDAQQSYEIQVSENESAERAAKLKLDLAKLDLEKWKQGEVKSKRQELAHGLERATKEEQRLHEKLDKSRKLKEKGFYSEDLLKQDELAWEQAVAALDKAKLDGQIYEQFEYPKDEKSKQSAVDEAVAELDRVQHQNVSKIASKEADRTNKQQALRIREQTFEKYRKQLDAAVIRAPQGGLVVYATSVDNARWGGDEGPLQVGSKVYPQQGLIVLPDINEMIAAVRVHESMAGRIRPGQAATVRVDAVGGLRFVGTVDSIGILAEQTSRWMDPNLREYTVKIALDLTQPPIGAPQGSGSEEHKSADPAEHGGRKRGGGGGGKPERAGGEVAAGAPAPAPTEGSEHAAKSDAMGPASADASARGLKPSMRCEAEIVLGRVDDATTVPIQAVFNEGVLRYVLVADSSGRFARRPVLLGQRSDRFGEVKVGLKPGERVLLRKPEPGEILAGSWKADELAAVGLKLDERGQVVSAGGGGGPGGGPGGGRSAMARSSGREGGPGRGKPDGASAPAKPAETNAASEGEAKPEAESKESEGGTAHTEAAPAVEGTPSSTESGAAAPAAAPAPASGGKG